MSNISNNLEFSNLELTDWLDNGGTNVHGSHVWDASAETHYAVPKGYVDNLQTLLEDDIGNLTEAFDASINALEAHIDLSLNDLQTQINNLGGQSNSTRRNSW